MKNYRFAIFLVLSTGLGQGQPTFQGMNPNIGIIGDFSYQNHFKANGLETGFLFREAEVSFRMVLDPYARADFFIAIVPPTYYPQEHTRMGEI